MIFGALMVLTVITVGVSYLHLPIAAGDHRGARRRDHQGIAGRACIFMHLLHERKVIYWVLMLTVIFFVFLMFVPLLTNLDRIPGSAPERCGSTMSLKWFHIVFISLSVLLSLWFGVWGLFNEQIALGIVSLAASAGLVRVRQLFPRARLRKLGV